jgi:hypothetical protein
MTPRVPGALTEADLPIAELASARLDGELFALAGSWCPIDALDGPETRAAAILPAAPHRSVAERLTAAWIYGLAPEPTEHQFCVDVSARTGTHAGAGLRLREVRLAADDTALVGRLIVTTPIRTAVDLARWGAGAGRPADPALIAALLARAGFRPTADGGVGASAEPLLAGLRGVSFTRIAQEVLEDALRLLGRD